MWHKFGHVSPEIRKERNLLCPPYGQSTLTPFWPNLTLEVFGPALRLSPPEPLRPNLIAASIYDKCSVGPSIRPICTRCCFKMTYLVQVCSNLGTTSLRLSRSAPTCSPKSRDRYSRKYNAMILIVLQSPLCGPSREAKQKVTFIGKFNQLRRYKFKKKILYNAEKPL